MTQVPGRRRWRSTISGWLTVGLVVAAVLALAPRAHAGGGGEDMLLLVNARDEQSLRVANAYASLRAIPDRHILFVDPYRADGSLPVDDTMPAELFRQRIATPLVEHLDTHGLNEQIDFIGAIGLPYRVWTERGQVISLTAALNLSDPVGRGASLDETVLRPAQSERAVRRAKWKTLHAHSFIRRPSRDANDGPLPVDHNAALHVVKEAPPEPVRPEAFYTDVIRVAGMVAYTGINGNTPDAAVRALRRSAEATGTHPDGVFHFVTNAGDPRNFRQRAFENEVLPALKLRGLRVKQQDSARAFHAPDAIAVMTHSGAIFRRAEFLPGAWADNVTSHDGKLHASFVNMTDWLAQGAAATSGTVEEPYAVSLRFPHPGMMLSIADGLNLAEAYAGAVAEIHLNNFVGDLLGQPYAHVPKVTLNAGPVPLAAVRGTIVLEASATVERGPVFEHVGKDVAVDRLELYVDGKHHQTRPGAAGTFELDTTSLSDGHHELRIVAVTDTNAESQGQLIRTVRVDNRGRSVRAEAAAAELDADEPLHADVRAAGGAVRRIELRLLGNPIAALEGGAGRIEVGADKLAFGGNRLVPVAVFDDGAEVAGAPLSVHRRPPPLRSGGPVTPRAERQRGLAIAYHFGVDATRIEEVDFTAPPDRTDVIGKLLLKAPGAPQYPNPAADPMPEGLDVDGLAVRVRGLFEVEPDEAGEYTFFIMHANDSGRLLIDGVALTRFDSEIYFDAQGRSVWLGPGEHELVFEAVNHVVGEDGRFHMNVYYREPGGATRRVGQDRFYVHRAP